MPGRVRRSDADGKYIAVQADSLARCGCPNRPRRRSRSRSRSRSRLWTPTIGAFVDNRREFRVQGNREREREGRLGQPIPGYTQTTQDGIPALTVMNRKIQWVDAYL